MVRLAVSLALPGVRGGVPKQRDPTPERAVSRLLAHDADGASVSRDRPRLFHGLHEAPLRL